MDDEQPGQRHVGAQEHAEEQAWRVEDVPVHRADVRHPAEQVRVPLGEMASQRQHHVPKISDRVAADVLIAPRRHEKSAGERRVGENHGDGGVDQRRPRGAEPWAGVGRWRTRSCHGARKVRVAVCPR